VVLVIGVSPPVLPSMVSISFSLVVGLVGGVDVGGKNDVILPLICISLFV
jgi:hypothetical protein